MSKFNPDTGKKFSRVEYHKRECLKLIGRIEEVTGQMFHLVHGDIEKRFWAGYDENHSYKLSSIYRELCELHDFLTMD